MSRGSGQSNLLQFNVVKVYGFSLYLMPHICKCLFHSNIYYTQTRSTKSLSRLNICLDRARSIVSGKTLLITRFLVCATRLGSTSSALLNDVALVNGILLVALYHPVSIVQLN